VAGTIEVGRVDALWRYPVKSMLGERVESAWVTERGVLGDRGYALVETETGMVASAKHPRHWSELLACRASYTVPPRSGDELPPVRVTLPDGSYVRSDDPHVHERLSAFAGRAVELTSSAPERPIYEVYTPDDGSITSEPMALVAPGTFFDAAPLHLLSTATLACLSETAPKTSFDMRRFRPNVVIETGSVRGFVDDGWVGGTLALGKELAVSVFLSTPRCVMTTLAHGELAGDNAVLQTIARHNRLDIPGLGPSSCAGVYGLVDHDGLVSVGDAVVLRA
jgi:uncharacterized protein YcbX